MIAEAGHYALVLALGLALIQSTVPLLGARWGDHALMNVARSTCARAIAVRGGVVCGADDAARDVGFLRRQRVREFALDEAAALQDHRRVGQSRRIDAAVGVDPGAVRRPGRRLRQQFAAVAARPCAGGAGLDRGRVLSVHPGHLESVPAHRKSRRSRAATSTRCCRTSASPCIRRCSISAMSGSRSRSPLRLPR